MQGDKSIRFYFSFKLVVLGKHFLASDEDIKSARHSNAFPLWRDVMTRKTLVPELPPMLMGTADNPKVHSGNNHRALRSQTRSWKLSQREKNNISGKVKILNFIF